MKAIVKVKNLPSAPEPTKRYRRDPHPAPVFSGINPYNLISPAAKRKKLRDSVRAGKSTGARYQHGHVWTDEEVAKLIELYKAGMVYAEMPDVLEISFSAIKHKVECLQKSGVIEYREARNKRNG